MWVYPRGKFAELKDQVNGLVTGITTLEASALSNVGLQSHVANPISGVDNHSQSTIESTLE